MTEETTTEQLAEIDRDMADIERQVAELVEEAQQADYKTQELPDKTQELETKTQELQAEYTPPEGWRVLAVGEQLQEGDQIVQLHDGKRFPTERAGQYVCETQRYIRPIESQSKPEPPDGWQLVPLGEPLKGGDEYHAGLDRYIRPIEPEPQAQPEPQPEPEPQAAAIEELRSEVSYVQNLLGTEKRRVTELEELVGSLRTINDAQEKAFEAAGKENTALRNQLTAVKAELASVAADRQRLRVELDAAQQVPADSPELRQLRADLAEVTQERDQHLDSYQRIFGDLETIRETTKAAAVEAIVEWLVPVQAAIAAPDNVDESTRAGWFAEEVIQHLPSIMRSLTGLNDEEIE